MLLEDLHTHTIYSHGKGTVEQNVLAAMERGLARVGIAEHGPGHLFYAVKWDALMALRRETDRMNQLYGDKIQVLMGLEANLLGDGKTDIPKDTSIFDFLMLGYHKGTLPCDAVSRRWLGALLKKQKARHAKENALAFIHALDSSGKLRNITHPGTYIPVDLSLLAKEAAVRNITLEINESHCNMGVEDIRMVVTAGAKLYLSSDAHRPEHVGVVQNSVALVRQAGALQHVLNWEE